VLIKDNHISVCGSIALAVKRAAQAFRPHQDRGRVRHARAGEGGARRGGDMILLDNMARKTCARGRALGRPRSARGLRGVRLETIRAIAETGVDFISVGRITQSAPAVDIGLDAVVRI